MRLLRRIVLAGLIVAAAGVLVVWLAASSRPGGVRAAVARVTGVADEWIGDSLRAVANDALGPELQFERFEYHYPDQATATNVRLVADGEAIVEIASVRLTMTEIPRRGAPVIIEAIELDAPVVRLLHRADGSVIGFDDAFVASAGAGDATDPDPPTPLSDIFAIRRLSIAGGRYEQRAADGRLMVLDELAVTLDSRPDGADPGRYAVDAKVDRPPALEASWKGHFHLDRLELGFDDTSVRVTLDEAGYQHLPSTLQEWLRAYEIVGRLDLKIAGTCPVGSLLDSELSVEADIADARAQLGAYALPAKHVRIVARMDERRLYLPIFDLAGVAGGRINVAGQLGLEGRQPVEATVGIDGIRVEDFVPSMQGRLRADGQVSLELADPAESMTGTGRGVVDEGRLFTLPIFDGLLTAMDVGARLGGQDEARDTLAADLLLHGDRVDLDDLDLVCRSIAAHGEGEIYYDGTIDFRFNGGPLEKVQRAVPVIGDLARVVTDRIVTYRATGTLGAPAFKVHPLGIGAEEGTPGPRTDGR